jgi:hypothetical protein
VINRNEGTARGNQDRLTQEQFDNVPLADLAKLAGHDETEPGVLCCDEVLRRSEKRFFECIAAGYDKATTAAIIAQHPLNAAQPAALERAMNRVFGNWRDLQRGEKLDEQRVTTSKKPSAEMGPSVVRNPSSQGAARNIRSLTDDTFSGEERL